MQKDIIISLYDFTGTWSLPWRLAGYIVIQIDIKHGVDILNWNYKLIDKKRVKGILIAQPCTDYAISGAKHFARKDSDGTTAQSQRLVKRTKQIIDYFSDADFWVLENPMTRIHKLNPWLGDVVLIFNPCDFAGYNSDSTDQVSDRYNKQTWLFGKFKIPTPLRLEPHEKDSPIWKKYGGKSERTKELRSITPKGFAKAFFIANNF